MLELELPGFGSVDLTAGDVGWQQVRGELDTVKVAFEVVGEGLDGGGFCQAGSALNQQVAIGQQGNQQTVHQFFLANNPFC